MDHYSSYTENQLLVKVAEGDETAFRAVYDRYKSSFHATAFKFTRSTDTAEDIVQEVFIALWKKRSYLANINSPIGYLMTILHNAIFYHFRKLGRERQMRQKVAGAALVQEDNSVEELLLAKENRALLEAIINKLTPQQQLIYKLSKQDGLSRDEIAAKLNVSPNTVKNHLAAAIQCIKNDFQKGASALIWATIWSNL